MFILFLKLIVQISLKLFNSNITEIMSFGLVLSQSFLGGVIGILIAPEDTKGVGYGLAGASILGITVYYHINKVNRKMAKRGNNADYKEQERIVKKELLKYSCTMFGALLSLCASPNSLAPNTGFKLLQGMSFGCFIMPTLSTIGSWFSKTKPIQY